MKPMSESSLENWILLTRGAGQGQIQPSHMDAESINQAGKIQLYGNMWTYSPDHIPNGLF
jgi:hypothetical protein